MKILKKYLEILWISYKSYTIYFYDILGINLIFILRIIVIIYLYKTIYTIGGIKGRVGGYTLQELSWALIFVQALVTSKPRIIEEINAEIKGGKIVAYLLNPISYIGYKFSEHFSKFFYNLLISFFIGMIMGFLLLGSINTSLYGIIGGILLVIGAMFINFFGNMMIGLIALFKEDSLGYKTIYDSFDRLFAGNILPIPFFPPFFQQIIFLSPFAYTGYTAGLIFIRFDMNKFLSYFGMTVTWSLIYVGICYFMFYKAQKKLVINGG